jgi:hypothetical protein
MDCRSPHVKTRDSRRQIAVPAAVFACGMLAVASPALGRTPPGSAPLLTRVEVVGNYAGRDMVLKIDGRVEYQGRGQLHPPGMSWTIPTANLGKPSTLELTIEPCPAPFSATYEQDGVQRYLVIQDCEIRFGR